MSKSEDFKISGDGVKFHDDHKRKDIVLPVGLTYDQAISALAAHKEAMESMVETAPVYFEALLDDGLVAASVVIEDMFGISFATGGMFDPPKSKAVKVSLTETVEVPYDQVAIPSLGATLLLGEGKDRNRPHIGRVFTLRAYVRRMDQPKITELIDAIAKRLKTHSIYRGQAVKVTSGGALDFVDTRKGISPDRIVFNSDVQKAIDRFVLGPLVARQELINRGISQKRSTLAYGPFGTGKSTLSMLAAIKAVETGHTFVQGGPAVDMGEVMRIAALYGPSVASVEDIDNVTNTSEASEVSALLEAFDGVTAKGADVKLLMTTNYKDRIHPGMFRPGRIDNWLYIGPSDRETMERLIRANVVGDTKLGDDVDFDALWKIVEGFTPAYIHEVLTKAVIGAVVAQNEGGVITLKGDDLVAAATIVHAQWQLMQDAVEPPKPPTLDQAFRENQVQAILDSRSTEAAKGAGVEASDHVWSAYQRDQINSIVRGAVSSAIDATVLMDPSKDSVKGALDVQ